MASAAELAIVLTLKDMASAGLQSIGGKLGGLGAAAAGAAALGFGALAVGLADSVGKASEFEQTLSGIAAVTGKTTTELSGIRDLALQLGKDTAFSASESAKAIEELIKGGLEIDDVMNGAALATVNLAAAGGVSIPEAATLAANALAQFSLKGEDMAHVADLIAGAANASAIDVKQFGYSLQAAGAVAATIGFSFDDLAQGIAIMGKAGITGSDAGTSLKTMMMNLQPQTKAQTALFRELGLVTADGANQFFTAEGKVKSMAEVAGLLQTALAGMSEQQRIAALETMFGSDAVRAGAILAKEGAEGFNAMAEAMGKVTAKQVADKRMDNLKGSLQALSGTLETMQIMIGSAFLPVLNDLVKALNEGLGGAMPFLEDMANGIVGAFEASKPGMQAFAEGVKKLLGGDVNGALDSFMFVVEDTGEKLGPALESWAQSFLAWIGPMIPPLLQQAAQMAQQFLTWVGSQIGPLVSQLGAWAAAFIDWVAPQIPPLLAQLGKLAADFLAWVTSQIGPLMTQLMKWGDEFVDWVAPRIVPMTMELLKLIGALLKWVGEQIPPLVTELLKWASAFISWIATSVIPKLAPELGKAKDAILDWIVNVGVPAMVENAIKLGKAIIDGIVQGLAGLAGRIATEINNALGRGQKKVEAEQEIQSPSRKWMREIGEPLGQGILDGLLDKLEPLGERVSEALSRVSDGMEFPTWTREIDDATRALNGFERIAQRLDATKVLDQANAWDDVGDEMRQALDAMRDMRGAVPGLFGKERSKADDFSDTNWFEGVGDIGKLINRGVSGSTLDGLGGRGGDTIINVGVVDGDDADGIERRLRKAWDALTRREESLARLGAV